MHRTTTEFTGWPSPPTTPFSIERLLAQQNAESIDISQLLGKTSTSATPLNTTTSTTTTTTTTVRPTQPGLCRSECDLAGTIRIVDGVVWTPELLDHNTEEWKNLAHEVEAQLNEVYNKSANLSHWYKKIRIDSFSQGSVLVDYFVELQNVTNQLNTLDIKRMFHEALSVAPPPVLPLPPKKAKKSDDDDDESELSSESSSEATPAGNDTDTTESSNSAEESSSSVSVEDIPVRPNMLLGKFVLDPVSTDFIGISFAILTVTGQLNTKFQLSLGSHSEAESAVCRASGTVFTDSAVGYRRYCHRHGFVDICDRVRRCCGKFEALKCFIF